MLLPRQSTTAAIPPGPDGSAGRACRRSRRRRALPLALRCHRTMNASQPTPGTGQGDQPPEYTLAGILHYMQSEWRQYERERNDWEIERAELRVCRPCPAHPRQPP